MGLPIARRFVPAFWRVEGDRGEQKVLVRYEGSFTKEVEIPFGL
jgi:hypothetical protein